MLSKLEVIALKGIQSREREIQAQHIKPLQDDLNSILADVETRLGIKFGQTHAMDWQNLTISPITAPKHEPPPENVALANPEPSQATQS